MEWIKNKNYIIGTYKQGVHLQENVLLFDLDYTLICPRNGKTRFSKNTDPNSDWKFCFKNTRAILNNFYKDGYKIAIISNQKGLKNKELIDEWIKRIESFSEKLNIPFTIFSSIRDNIYRKPLTGFFDKFFKNINYKKSFFCGDALGRIKDPSEGLYKNDFSDSDLLFSLNCGLQIKSPENIFLNKDDIVYEIKYSLPVDNKNNIIKYEDLEKDKLKYYYGDGISMSLASLEIYKYLKEKLMIINVGYPGSGKSFFTKLYLKKIKSVNQDTLKTKSKCINEAKKIINNKESLVIDNTNTTTETRKTWLDLGKKNNYNIICLYFTTPIDLCKHNNIYRMTKNNKSPVPEITYLKMKKYFNAPTEKEGFDKIIKIHFEPFSNDYYKFYKAK